MTTEVEILFEDPFFIAVNKRVAAATQVNGTDPLNARIRKCHPEKANLTLYAVHRLDNPVTGVVLYARTKAAASAMGERFSSGRVSKVYWAAVSSRPPETEGILEHYLTRDTRINKSTCHDSYMSHSRFCRTSYRLFGQSDRYWFLELYPETGRTHQLRAQLEAIGCPIKGDQKYGARRGNRTRLIHLHAYSLAFTHPFGESHTRIRAIPFDDPVWNIAREQYRESPDAAERP